MASRLTSASRIDWTRCLGGVQDISGRVAMPINRIPEGLVYSATNVDIYPDGILWRRPGLSAASSTGSPPTVGVRYLFAERDLTAEYLWAFQSNGSGAMTAARYNGSSWSTIALSDTVAALAEPHACRYNGKVFLAYNSNVNRLHVYDGTSVRRVGVVASAAATVANTGAGAYPATLRYYKIQWELRSGSTLVAESELSPSVSFTPSGAGTAARITQPTPSDSATHWVVYASADDVSYYELARIDTATTTYDDTNLTSIYGTVAAPNLAPLAGLHVPPPSAKYLATDGERLLMAGAFETTASSGETTPSPKRVWFTRPLGAIGVGDDEDITQTGDFRYYLDIDDPNDGAITALQQINGVVYVFFAESTWRLVPTGIENKPFRPERVSGTVGAESQLATCVGSTANNEEAIYFYSTRTGLNRVTLGSGVEWLGSDVVPKIPATTVQGVRLAYDRTRRDVWFISTVGVTGVYRIAVDFLRRMGDEYHGGARSFSSANSSVNITCGESYGGAFYLGGGTNNDSLYVLTPSATNDDGTAIAAEVRSPVWGDGLSRHDMEAPVLQVGNTLSSGTVVVEYWDPFAPSGINSRSVTHAMTGMNGRGIFRVGGISYADARYMQAIVSVSSGTFSAGPDVRIEGLSVPYTLREPL